MRIGKSSLMPSLPRKHILIGGLLEDAPTAEEIQKRLLTDLVEHIQGSGGGKISRLNLKLVAVLHE
jgi:hypothetical protein